MSFFSASLPENPNAALNDAALDKRVRVALGRDTSELPPSDYAALDVREAIGWAVIQHYGLDSRYGFDTWEDSLNLSKWSSLWHDGFSDRQRSRRIWELYMAKYIGEHIVPYYQEQVLESTLSAAAKGFGEGLKEGADNTLMPWAKAFQFIGNNLLWLVILGVVIVFLPQILSHASKSANAMKGITR